MTHRDISLQVEGINIEGRLYLPGRGEREACPAVCICHGIPSGIQRDSNDFSYPAFAERICNEGFAVFIFNFRGTGESGGNIDLTGWTKDLKAVIDYLVTLPVIDKTKITLLGFSAGAAILTGSLFRSRLCLRMKASTSRGMSSLRSLKGGM